MPLLGYDKAVRFSEAIERARIAATNSGVSADQTISPRQLSLSRPGRAPPPVP